MRIDQETDLRIALEILSAETFAQAPVDFDAFHRRVAKRSMVISRETLHDLLSLLIARGLAAVRDEQGVPVFSTTPAGNCEAASSMGVLTESKLDVWWMQLDRAEKAASFTSFHERQEK